MKQSIINMAIICGMLFLLGACSATKKGTSAVSKAESTLDKSLLWEVSGKGLSEPSYLFGTIHIISKSDYFMHDVFKEKFSECDLVAMEVKIDDPSMQATMMSAMVMPEGQNLEGLLGAEDYKKFVKFMSETTGMGEIFYKNVKPFYAQSFLYPKIIGEATESYEMSFAKMAKENDLEIIGLETIEEQMSFIDEISLEEQAEMLMEYVDDFDEQVKVMKDMIEVYKSQDVDGMYTMVQEESDEDSDFEEVLLTNRNKNWVKALPAIMKKQPTFIAVGAGHLGGPNGVIRLLQKEGYSVKAVK